MRNGEVRTQNAACGANDNGERQMRGQVNSMNGDYLRLAEVFERPPAAYRPMMFWVWNGDLDAERIRQQVRDMAAKGCGGFFIHPMGESFRLRDFVRGLSPGYLSDEYFAAVRVAVEAASDCGLYAWLYDEGGWPSGTAQGQVLEGHPEHAAKVLMAQRRQARPGEVLPCPEGFVAAHALCSDGQLELLAPTNGQLTAPGDALSVVLFCCERVPPRVDLLSEAAVARFIEVTHERYADCVGEFFGTVVPGIFTDEPAVAGRVGTAQVPWTDAMAERFCDVTGHDLLALLPALFPEEVVGSELYGMFGATQRAQIRCEFCDTWTRVFRDAYWDQINDWCAGHKLIHTGHVGGEDNLLDHARCGFGQFFRTAGSLDAPGVDAIWRQLHWAKPNFSFPKLAASAAKQMGPEPVRWPNSVSEFANLVVTETNGVYGLGLTFQQMKWLVDYHCLCGVNLIAPMAYSYETSGGLLYRTQDHMGPGNPLWELYGGFSDYVGRLCAVLRGSLAPADVAVYYPIEALWPDPESLEAQQAWASVQGLVRALEEEQVAFDYVDADALFAAEAGEGLLDAPGELFGTVIVPQTPRLPRHVMERLWQMHGAGARVVFLGGVPEQCSGLGGDDEKFRAWQRDLTQAAVRLDLAQEQELLGGDTEAGLDEGARWDGLASAMLMPRNPDHFSAAARADDAVLVVPEEEIGRLARLMALKTGRFGIQPASVVPDLRLSTREVGRLELALLMNAAMRELRFELEVLAEDPSVLERWDPTDGRRHPLAVHEEVSEFTRVPMMLRPGEATLLVLRPLAEGEKVTVEPPPHVHETLPPVVIDRLDTPDAVYVVREHRIEEGRVVVQEYAPGARPAPPRVQPWEELLTPEFSGTVAYEFSFRVAEDYLSQEVFLDLGEVCYCAHAVLNGHSLPSLLWPPYVAEVSGLLRPHENQLTIHVTNTLANQACAERVVAEAKLRGWFNSYYERALPMMRESLRSGLIGPVGLCIRG